MRLTIPLLILIMVIVVAGVSAITLRTLYLTAFAEEHDRLRELAQSQARLIEAVARFDAVNSAEDVPGGAVAATLGQMRDAHQRFRGFGKTGEFTLARREGDQIVFLLHPSTDIDRPQPVPIASKLAEPMRRALAGQSGWLVGLDYRGEVVLAAYEPVAVLNMGIVAKIDMAEIRAPFIRAGFLAAGGAIVLVLLGAGLFVYVGNPIVRRLVESEASYRAVVEETPVLICRYLAGGVIAYVNDAYCAYSEKDRDELVGKSFFSLIPQSDRRAVEAEIASLSRAAPTRTLEHRVTAPDGGIRWQRWTHRALFDAAGDVTAYQSIGEDVTERRRAEQALIASEARYRRHFELGAIGMGTSSPQKRWLEVNDRLCEMLGYSRDELLSMTWEELTVADDLPGNLVLFEQVRAGERDAYVLEKRFVRKDGEKVETILSSVCVRDEDGTAKYFLILVQDITERKRAEEALRESNRRLLKAQRVSRMGFLDWNLKTNDMYWSEEVYRLYGIDPRKTRSSIDLTMALVHPDDLGFAEENLKVALAGGKAVDNDHRVVRPDGEVIWVHAQTELSRDAEGEPAGLLGTVVDITDRKRAEDEIRKLNEHLEERVAQRTAQLRTVNEELKSFAYSVSHDLRAPLRGIDGFSKALLEDYGDKLDANGADFLNRVRAATGHMSDLIDDLLALSRISSDVMRHEHVNLSAAAEEIAAELRTSDADRSVALTVQPGMRAEGDERMLRLLMRNLLSNAWKFTSKRARAEIEFAAVENGGETVYYVRDNGVGFDMVYVDKLFGAFQRLHSTAEFPGTGVGLAIAQRVVSRHGGRIWGEGVVHGGATFSFTLHSNRGDA